MSIAFHFSRSLTKKYGQTRKEKGRQRQVGDLKIFNSRYSSLSATPQCYPKTFNTLPSWPLLPHCTHSQRTKKILMSYSDFLPSVDPLTSLFTQPISMSKCLQPMLRNMLFLELQYSYLAGCPKHYLPGNQQQLTSLKNQRVKQKPRNQIRTHIQHRQDQISTLRITVIPNTDAQILP